MRDVPRWRCPCRYVAKLQLRVEATGSAKKWNCALVEVVDANCSSATPNGFLFNTWIAPDAPVTAVRCAR